ncbi:MAG: hypothetical protein M1819_003473 [Sarea resinae]|nr:MAG: hypothetical protein M1819_003473 [Sarea resinae]
MDVQRLAWRESFAIPRRAWITHLAFFAVSLFFGALVPSSRSVCTSKLVHSHESCPTAHAIPIPHPEPASASRHEDTRTPFELPVFQADIGQGSYGDDTPSTSGHQYEFVRFNGNPDAKSPYKGPPTPAVDAAWDSLWAANMVISGELYASTEPEYPAAGVKDSTREDAFFATFEATHQLHCLYTLFRASYVDYYEPERKFMQHDPDRYHARLDILRQKLMWYVNRQSLWRARALRVADVNHSDSDASVATYNWVRGKQGPVANYNVLHRCRKHEVLLRWGEKHAATGAVFNRTDAAKELDKDP